MEANKQHMGAPVFGGVPVYGAQDVARSNRFVCIRYQAAVVKGRILRYAVIWQCHCSYVPLPSSMKDEAANVVSSFVKCK